MSSPDTLMHKHGATTACLFVSTMLMVSLDLFAKLKIDMSQRRFVRMNARTMQDLRFFDFVHGFPFMVVAYVLLFQLVLIGLELLGAATSLRIFAFVALWIPIAMYGMACLRLGAKFAA